MTYTKDNILNLRFRRGGTAEYVIKKVRDWGEVDILQLNGGRVNQFSLLKALQYFTSGRWTVVGKGKEETVLEEIYQIY